MVGLEKYYEKSSQVLWSEGASLPGVVADTSRGLYNVVDDASVVGVNWLGAPGFRAGGLLPTLSGNYATNRNGLSGS